MKTFKEYLIAEAAEDDTNQEEASIANASKTINDMRKILRQGVNRLLKLDHPQKGEDVERHASRTVDAYDMLEAMEVLPSNSKARDPIVLAEPALQDDHVVLVTVKWLAYWEESWAVVPYDSSK